VRRNARNLPLINTDDTDRKRSGDAPGCSGKIADIAMIAEIGKRQNPETHAILG
jgi:hypothetical protein